MPIAPPTPARWPALLFCSGLWLALPGCSLLQRAPDPAASPASTAGAPHAADTADIADTDNTRPAFGLTVQAPPPVRPTLERHLDLQRFRSLGDLQPDELQRLVDAAPANARDLLGTLGYFAPQVEVQWQPQATTPNPLGMVTVKVEPGPSTTVGDVQLRLDHTGEWDPDNTALQRTLERLQRNWSLPAGEFFTQSAWDGAKTEGLRRLQARRYPAAHIASSQAEIDTDLQHARLEVAYAPGPAYRFGPLRIEGSERYDPDGARRIARLPTGAVYEETELLDAQQRLAASGYYDAVYLRLQTEAEDPQAAPVVAQVREAPLQKVVFGVGASTDSGPRLSIDHTHNRMPGLGWRAVSKLAMDRDNREVNTTWTDLPDEQGWRWTSSGQLQRQKTGALDTNNLAVSAGRAKSTSAIDRTYFVQYDSSETQGTGAPTDSAALSLNYGWTGRYFNDNTAPTRGWGLALEIGAGATLRPYRDPFLRTRIRWQSFLSAGRVQAANGASRSARIALRSELGAVLARDRAEIPLAQLFLTGGDTTVRGYGYRAIGARTESGLLYGGRYLAVGSVEWQRPIVWNGTMSDWESTVFLDAGAVADRPQDWRARVGVGTGVRWRSPVGPLQADVAYGVQAKQLRLHLRLGFSF